MEVYTNQVKTQDEALCHLFFHCCYKDGEFKKTEIENVSAKLVAAGLHTNMNFKQEIIKYQQYEVGITDEIAYLAYLLQLIKPVNDLALYSYCAELCLSDASLSTTEEILLDKLAALLKIPDANHTTIKKLMTQRKIVEMEKIY